jgi:hypothetical protein
VFFSATLQGDNHGQRITEEALDPGKRYKTGKPIEVVKGLEFGHRQSMTSFPPE